MADINLSHAVRSNLLSLQSTAANMAKTQERLATGLKVNSALDNPTNFFTASALNSRAGDMASLLDSMSSGIKTIEAADNGLKSIVKTVETMQSTLRQARQDKSFKTVSMSLDAANINGITGQTRQITFTGGAFGTTGTASVSLTKATNATSTQQNAYAPVAASTSPVANSWGSYTPNAGNQTFQVKGNNDSSAINLTVAGGSNINSAITSINQQLSASGSSVRVRESVGALQFFDGNAANVGAGATIAITATLGSDALNITPGANINAAGTPRATQQIAINGHAITLNGDDHRTPQQAAAHINTTLKAQGAAEGLKASVENDKLVITGPDDGTGVTLGGADVALFGTPVTTTAKAAGDAAGTVKSVDELVFEINGSAALNTRIRASNDNGKLRIENLSTTNLSIEGVSGAGAINGLLGTTNTAEIGRNDVRRNLVTQFNELRDQLDKFSDDASFNG
ncbi:MAG: hypothetical protein EON59_11965, partial [Alphaproteobacteria bacterium]